MTDFGRKPPVRGRSICEPTTSFRFPDNGHSRYYSITRVACSMISPGNVMPSALAVR